MSTQPMSAGKGKSAKGAKGGAAKRHRKQTASTNKLGGPAIRRLARRAGATRVGKGCFPEVNLLTNNYLNTVLGASCTYCTHSKRKTINCQDVVYALKRVGVRYMGHPFSK
ncbi:HHF1 [Ecytonucleospora hepatopenaei]|uniref:HHF1 n=1 Tax=Ecytonucleospora hepatopenaei TaxID=646526 RepID=A0A1W0E6U0_9MICR|nr:HHF1 [Ecytonucleospora hepatopenaei]